MNDHVLLSPHFIYMYEYTNRDQNTLKMYYSCHLPSIIGMVCNRVEGPSWLHILGISLVCQSYGNRSEFSNLRNFYKQTKCIVKAPVWGKDSQMLLTFLYYTSIIPTYVKRSIFSNWLRCDDLCNAIFIVMRPSCSLMLRCIVFLISVIIEMP